MKGSGSLFLSFLLLATLSQSASSQDMHWTITDAPQANYKSIAVAGSAIFVGAEGGKIYRSINNGDSWQELIELPGDAVNALAVSGSTIFAGVSSYFTGVHDIGVFRSTDNGDSWKQLTAGLPNALIHILALGISGTTIFAGGSGIYTSTNNGDTWVSKNTGFGSQAFAISGTTIFARAGGKDGVFRSTNNGDTWTGMALGNAEGWSVAATGTTIFAAKSDSGIYRSADQGGSWERTSVWRQKVSALGISTTSVFADISNIGVIRSMDNGDTWLPTSNGLINSAQVHAFGVSGSTNFAVSNLGVFRTSLTGNSVPSAAKEDVDFLSVYPNPFVSFGIVRYKLRSQSNVTLTIYDGLGRIEAKLIEDKEQEAGEHEVQINMQDQSAGLYSCHLQADGMQYIFKVIVVK